MDQHLIDYTVRNITTGDEEDIRVLELTDDEMAGFPDEVRDEIQSLIAYSVEGRAGVDSTRWETAQEQIRQLLLPYISDRWLYDSDYSLWEGKVLDADALDMYPPEDIADAVRAVLTEAIDAAIENWDEGAWSDFKAGISRGDVLRYFGGYIEAVTEGELDSDTQPLMLSDEGKQAWIQA